MTNIKNLYKTHIFILLLLIISVLGCKKDKDTSAIYEVTFSFYWNSQNFPTDYPDNAHFSKLVGWSHKSNSTFFQTGTMASQGIEDMAETGSNTVLISEIESRISKNEGLDMVEGEGLSTGTGTITVELSVNKDMPSITLATMIAPSPDWYIAVVNINLYENEEFVAEKNIDANVYDAGTDDGVTFKSLEADSDPKQNISLFVGTPLGNGTSINPVIASVKFKKK